MRQAVIESNDDLPWSHPMKQTSARNNQSQSVFVNEIAFGVIAKFAILSRGRWINSSNKLTTDSCQSTAIVIDQCSLCSDHFVRSSLFCSQKKQTSNPTLTLTLLMLSYGYHALDIRVNLFLSIGRFPTIIAILWQKFLQHLLEIYHVPFARPLDLRNSWVVDIYHFTNNVILWHLFAGILLSLRHLSKSITPAPSHLFHGSLLWKFNGYMFNIYNSIYTLVGFQNPNGKYKCTYMLTQIVHPCRTITHMSTNTHARVHTDRTIPHRLIQFYTLNI